MQVEGQNSGGNSGPNFAGTGKPSEQPTAPMVEDVWHKVNSGVRKHGKKKYHVKSFDMLSNDMSKYAELMTMICNDSEKYSFVGIEKVSFQKDGTYIYIVEYIEHPTTNIPDGKIL